jgi:hypothetical protein
MAIRDFPLQIVDCFLDALKNSGQRLNGGGAPRDGARDPDAVPMGGGFRTTAALSRLLLYWNDETDALMSQRGEFASISSYFPFWRDFPARRACNLLLT